MFSIIAVITALLSTTAIGGPVSADVHECTIYAPKSSDYSNYTTFDGYKYQLPSNPHLVRKLIVTDLGDKGMFNLRAKFDYNAGSRVLQALALEIYKPAYGSVIAEPKLIGDVVTTSEFDGSSTEHSGFGTYTALNGTVKYTLHTSLTEATMNFVVNDDIFIDVIQWELFPSGRPTITLKQPAYYDLEPRNKPHGQCVNL